MSWNNPSASALPNTNEITGGPGSYLLTNVLRGFDAIISSAPNTLTNDGHKLKGYRTRLYICFVQLDSAVSSGRPNAGGDATNLTHTCAKLIKDMLVLLPASNHVQLICQNFRTYCRDFGTFRGVDPVYLTLLGL